MKDELIINKLGLVHKVIKDLNCNYKDHYEYEEYFQIGVLGLIRAVRKYNEINSTTILYTCIKNEIMHYFNYNIRQKRYNGRLISLDKEINNKDLYLKDIIPSNINIEKDYINKETKERLLKALNKLKNRQYKTFIIEYYGINDYPLNHAEISRKYGVSRQFVQQSIKRGLNHLRKEFKNEKIYFED